MGCDIHVRFEYKSNMGKKGWMDGTSYMLNKYYGVYEDEPQLVEKVWFRRNYVTFALLAGVRNRDLEVKPFSSPRGIPDDVSAPVLQEIERWGVDGHSHSHITMDELQNFCSCEGLVQTIEGKAYLKKDLFKEYLKEMQCIINNGYADRPEDVRMVFWFDS